MASNYWGIPRTTHDLDFVVQLSDPTGAPILREFSGDFYIDEKAVRAAQQPHIKSTPSLSRLRQFTQQNPSTFESDLPRGERRKAFRDFIRIKKTNLCGPFSEKFRGEGCFPSAVAAGDEINGGFGGGHGNQFKSSFWQDAETSTLEACAPRILRLRETHAGIWLVRMGKHLSPGAV